MIWYVLLVLHCFHPCWVQEPNIQQKMLRRFDLANVELSADGTAKFQRFGALMWDYFPYCSLLPLEEVQKEAELTDSQIEEIDSLRLKLSGEFQSIVAEFPNAPFNPESHSACESFYNESATEMRKILLPAQLERLQQIERQLAVRTQGFVPFLLQFAKAQDATLDSKRLQVVKDAAKKFSEEEIPKLERKCEKEIDSLYDVLTSNQRRKLEDLLSKRPLPTYGPDITLAQLKFAHSLTEELKERSLDWKDQSEYYMKAPIFRSRYDGKFEARTEGSLPGNFWWLEFANFISQTSTDQLPMPTGDLEVLKEIYSKAQQEEEQDWQDYQQRIESLEGQAASEANIAYHLRNEERHAKFVEDFSDALSPVGKQVLMDYYRRRSEVRYGVFASLLQGALGNEIELTSEQKSRLRQRIETVVSRLENEFRDTETAFQKAVFDVAGGDLERKYHDAMGEPMKHIQPTFVMLTGKLR